MTSTREKLRAAFLSVLMVVSVFGGSLALSGAAAAATNPQLGNVTPAEVDENQIVNNQVVTFTVDGYANDSTTDTVQLTVPNRYADDLSVNNAVTSADVTVTGSPNIVDGPDNDGVSDTIQYDVETSGDGTQVSELGADFDFTAPDVSQDTNLPVRFRFQDSGGDNVDSTFDTVLIRNNASADADLVLNTNGDANKTFEDIAFQGQIVVAQGFTAGETVNVRRVTESGDTLVREESADSTGEVTLDTEDLGQAGDFFFVGQGDGNETGFEHVIQTATVEFDEDTVDNDAEVGDSRVNVTVDSNRAGSFDHFVRSDQLSDEDLVRIFPSAVNPTNVDTNDDGETQNDGIRITAGQGAVAPVNFDDVETGDYTFTFNVTDTTASDSASVTVVEPGRGEITFENNIIRESRGDVADIEMNLDNVDRGRLVIGSNESNYNATVSFEDTDDDGTVTVTLNTLTPNANSAFDARNEDDTVNLDRLAVGTTEGKALDPQNYELSVRLADTDEQTDLGTLSIQEAEARSLSVATAPDGSYNDLNNLEEIRERQEEGEYTPTDNVAQQDVLIYEYEGSGLFGALASANGSSTTDKFINASALNQSSVDFFIQETADSRTANRPVKAINFDQSAQQNGLRVVSDADNDTAYVILDTDNLVVTDGDDPTSQRSLDAGDEFFAEITLRANAQFGSDVEELDSANTTSTVVERSAEFDTTGEVEIDDTDAIVVRGAQGQVVSGTTTVAPGTELDITLSNDSPSLFISGRDTVTQNGTFQITADFSQYPNGQNFTAAISGQGFENNAATPGIVRGQVATVEFNNQTFSGQADSVNVASASLSDGGFITIHDNTVGSDALGSVRGTSDYLEPGEVENVTVALDEPIARGESGDTFFAMPHLDTDGDQTYDFVTSEGSDDAPYTDADGNIVLDGGVITIERAPSVTFNDQESNGETVEVQNAQLPQGGFVTIHDDTVANDPLGSVVGTSTYLDPGRSSSIEITLDEPIEENGQYFAMPHLDTDGDETYDFVTSEGSDDAPYTNENGDIVLDGAQITVESAATASVTFEDQTLSSDGTVTVASASLSEGGFVTIHDETVGDDALGSVVGTSDYLESGTSEDIEIAVDTDAGQHFAMPHLDTNGNEEYDFVSSEGSADGPYTTSAGEIVLDGAQIDAPDMSTATPTDEPTPTETDEPADGGDGGDTDTETTSDGQPGFGLALSLIALIGAALIALRRRD